MSSHRDRAVSSFQSGYNCAQATAAVFAPDFGLAPELVATLVAGLGGGRGGQRETCGAVSAMAIVAGLAGGSYPPEDLAAKRELYATVREMEREFCAVHGSTVCRELLRKVGVEAKAEPSPRGPAYYATRPCARFVATAATIASRMLHHAGTPRVDRSASDDA